MDGAGIVVRVIIVLLHPMLVRIMLPHCIETDGFNLTGEGAIGEMSGSPVIGGGRGWPDICIGLSTNLL